MYDGVYFIFLKYGVKLLFVANVALIKLNLFSDYFLNALKCLVPSNLPRIFRKKYTYF